MSNTENIRVVGGMRTVEFAVLADGTKPGKDFFDKLPPKTQRQLRARFEHIAGSGESMAPEEIFKHERAAIWTFKARLEKRHIRLPCFRLGRRWIITHGFVKPPKSKWPEQQFTRAFEVMNDVVGREPRNPKETRR